MAVKRVKKLIDESAGQGNNEMLLHASIERTKTAQPAVLAYRWSTRGTRGRVSGYTYSDGVASPFSRGTVCGEDLVPAVLW